MSAPLLVPREHGTYGELLFPLVTVAVLGAPGRAAWGLALLALGGYLAHEGLVVALGARGSRAQREQRAAARRSLLVFGGAAVAGAALAVPGLDPRTSTGSALAAGLSAVALAAAWTGRERTLAGEALAAVALPAWSVPVGLAAGLSWRTVLSVWTVWAIAFVAATCAVHAVISRTTRRGGRLERAAGLAAAAGGLAAAAALGRAGLLERGIDVALLPAAAAALAVIALPVRATRLRQIGWSFMAVAAVTLLLLVWALG